MNEAWATMLMVCQLQMAAQKDRVKWKGNRLECDEKKVSCRRVTAKPGAVHVRHRFDCRFTLHLYHGDGVRRLGESLSSDGGRRAPAAGRTLGPGVTGITAPRAARSTGDGGRPAQSV